MDVRSYKRKDLQDFIDSSFFNDLINIPISKHRALSQINNPRATDEDILLVVQYDENRVVGYIGLLPDFVYSTNGYEKITWFTCFWVDEKYKSQNVAANLFLRAIRASELKVCITNIVPFLEPIYQKTKIFQPTLYKEGFRGYLRFNFATILPPKKKIFQKAVYFLKSIDSLLNVFNSLRLKFFKRPTLSNIKCEYLVKVDNELAFFMNSCKPNSWTQRSQLELNWILNNPWILHGAKSDANSSRYYFSSLSEAFFYQIIKFSDENNNMIGFIILNVRDKNLTVPYLFFKQKNIEFVADFLTNTMLEMKLKMITIFNSELIEAFKKSKSAFYFTKTISKPYLIAKKLDFIDKLHFQDGDGDCAFY